MGRKVHGELSTKRTISQMQTHWKSLISLHLPNTGEQKNSRNKYSSSLDTQTHTSHSPPLSAALQGCGQVAERWFRLKLFCLSARSHLLHADPYYTPASGQREVGRKGRRAEEKKGDDNVRRAAESIKNEIK